MENRIGNQDWTIQRH